MQHTSIMMQHTLRPTPRQQPTPSLPRTPAPLVQTPLATWHLLRTARRTVVPRASAESEPLSYARDITKPRFVQHKTEAFWFYRFLSIVYDHIVNPGHWTVDMRTEALEPAQLNSPDLKVWVGGMQVHTRLHWVGLHWAQSVRVCV